MKKNSRFIKVLIAVGVVAASGGVSLGITSLVSANTSSAPDVVAAAESGSGSVADTSSASGVASSAIEDSSASDDATSESTETKSMRGGKVGAHSASMAELFGMTQDELRDALRSGKSLATIAEEKNVELSKVTDLLVAEFSAHLDEEVASGEHTREEADAKLAMFKENVDEMVTKTPPARGEGVGRGGHGSGRHGHGKMNGPTDQLQDLEGNETALNA